VYMSPLGWQQRTLIRPDARSAVTCAETLDRQDDRASAEARAAGTQHLESGEIVGARRRDER
jgi:hypothetical protein